MIAFLSTYYVVLDWWSLICNNTNLCTVFVPARSIATLSLDRLLSCASRLEGRLFCVSVVTCFRVTIAQCEDCVHDSGMWFSVPWCMLLFLQVIDVFGSHTVLWRSSTASRLVVFVSMIHLGLLKVVWCVALHDRSFRITQISIVLFVRRCYYKFLSVSLRIFCWDIARTFIYCKYRFVFLGHKILITNFALLFRLFFCYI